MRQIILFGTIGLFLFILHGCAAESVKAGTYEALYQKQCMDRAGEPNCDPDHKDYNAYQKDREEALKP